MTVDFFAGEEHLSRGGGHVRPYVDWENNALYTEIVGTVKDITPPVGRQARDARQVVILQKPHNPALGYLFTTANSTLDEVLATFSTYGAAPAQSPQLVAANSAWCQHGIIYASINMHTVKARL
ncbi:hypothetical protein B0H16DRAFT_1452846 [Mycena metata]|uniref:Uncharacterized protein n=1 Tax=Mycena metata TaxID=1033252 RepID=A0AAD7JP06_9AGAR|nr:hypothetical protein B0H16DRAFT_1452846 [Mycena metata]